MKKEVIKNTTANLISRLWTILSNFLFVPAYIHLLGAEAYGLTTFFATMQVVLNLMGAGLSQTLRREFASKNEEDTLLYKFKQLRSVELIYAIIALLIILICGFLSGPISSTWLQAVEIDVSIVKQCIFLMGVSIAIQLLSNLYLGVLFGSEKQVLANTIQVTWSLVRNGGVILVLIARPSVLVFFGWFVLCDIIYTLVLRVSINYRVLDQLKTKEWKLSDLRYLSRIYKYALGILAISIGYVINSQIDKILISHSFTLTELGAYITMFSLSYLTTIVASAVGIAVFPKFTGNYTSGNITRLNQQYTLVNGVVSIFTITIGCFIAFYAYDILLIWTQNETIPNIMRDSAIFVALGTMLISIEEIPYNYLLARGLTNPNKIQTLASIIYVLVFTPLFIKLWGIKGASISWLIEMGLSCVFYMAFFLLRFFKEDAIKLLWRQIVFPLLFGIGTALLSSQLLKLILPNGILKLIFAFLIGVFVISLELYIFYREQVTQYAKSFVNKFFQR